ncbi:hypothetical protein [Hydrogenophaga sp.]|jgi:alkyl hydroperoxide reductase subunit AhpC|uniref:hypothetical protein n=1 Tax=Hydrogenophaga sp. TaxID=1904254 RepID=UPI003F6F288E
MERARWSPALLLGFEPMDIAHQASAELLARAQAAPALHLRRAELIGLSVKP